jgi:hypothetical protein
MAAVIILTEMGENVNSSRRFFVMLLVMRSSP